MKKRYLAFALFLLFLTDLPAQQVEHVLGDVIVQLKPGTDIRKLSRKLQTYKGTDTQLSISKELSPPLRIWLLKFDFANVHENYFLHEISRQPEVENAQLNHLGEYRQTVPDDPFFDQQWMWLNTGQSGGLEDADIDLDLAWDLTTGGLTTTGQEIVVCVIEGANREHPDLQGNLWFNENEIEGNGIDDDGNGYVDDYTGWNIDTDDDNVNPEGHGTTVAGMIGAKGNNGQFLTGVNWNVKVMNVDFSGVSEANSIEAYTYPLVMRRLYNETGGEKGAFIVSTNASWGINNGDPADAPIWCAMYDSLGAVGILSCGATSNSNVNIDVVLDLPTACPSEYMVAVTATNDEDVRTFAGYGVEQIDVAAPGENIIGLNLNGGPSSTSGTSFASPTVAGIIGLLYATPCSNLGPLALGDPAAAAELVRDAIYNGVDVVPALVGEVKYGRVNVFNSMNLILQSCGPCPKPFGITVSSFSDVEATLEWGSTDSTLQSNLRFRLLGDTVWTDTFDVQSPFLMQGLTACTEYEFQLEDICADTLSGYTDSFVFKTDGCCEAPKDLNVFNVTATSASATWESVLAANSYNLLLFSPTDTVLTTDLTDTFFDFGNLDSCTFYGIQVQTVCDTGATDFGTLIEFTTFGCGACTDLNYCASNSANASEEWIANVNIGTLDNTSGSDDGYGDFTGLSTDLMTYEAYNISLSPGFGGFSFPEWFIVYIDFNQDGDFDDPGEEAFNAGGTSNQPVDGTIIIPGDAAIGLTRMRVAMRWNGEPDGPCIEGFNFGEVEDYCLNISEGTPPNCLVPADLSVENIEILSADFSWGSVGDATGYEIRVKPTAIPTWGVIASQSTSFSASNLLPCTEYEFQVRSICIGTESDWSASTIFMTGCFPPCDDIPGSLDTADVTMNTASLSWAATTNAISYRLQYKESTAPTWDTAISGDTDFVLVNLGMCTEHEYRVQAICQGGQSEYSPSFVFMTACLSSTRSLPSDLEDWTIYPNPFSEVLGINFTLLKSSEVSFDIFATDGRKIMSRNGQFGAGQNSLAFSDQISALSPGLYFVKMETEKGVAVQKVIKK